MAVAQCGTEQKMADTENFGEWLEEHLPLIIDQNIVSLAVIGIDNEDNLKSLYWRTSVKDRQMMAAMMMNDNLLEMIRANRDEIIDILNGEDDDDG